MIGCKDPECDISKFFNPMEDIIYDSDKDYDCKRNFFMAQALKFPNVSNTMSQLKNKERNKEQAEILIESLKSIEKLKEEQKRINRTN